MSEVELLQAFDHRKHGLEKVERQAVAPAALALEIDQFRGQLQRGQCDDLRPYQQVG